jgi:hypothetical protein
MEVDLLEFGAHHALFHFRSFPGFDLSFDIGTMEGIVLYCEKTPTCLIKRVSPEEAELLCSWR